MHSVVIDLGRKTSLASLFSLFFEKKVLMLKSSCLFISFFDPFLNSLLHLFFKIHFWWQKNHCFFFHLFLLRWTSYYNHIYTGHTVTCWVMWPSRDSIGRMLGWHAQIEKCNQVCVFAHVDEVVHSGCWRVAASWLFFSQFVLHAWCSGSVRVDCCAQCAILVCLLVHDTRICIKAQTQIRVCSQLCLSDPSLSSSCRAEHICVLTGQIVTECSGVWYALWIAGSVNSSHESESHRESEFISTRHHLHYILLKKRKNDSGAGVTVYGMSGTEGQDPGWTDPIDLQLPRRPTGKSLEQSTPQSTAPVTRLIDTESLLQVTPYQGVNDHVFIMFFFFSFFVPFL